MNITIPQSLSKTLYLKRAEGILNTDKNRFVNQVCFGISKYLFYSLISVSKTYF